MSSVTGGREGPGPMRKLSGEGPACATSMQLLAWGFKPVFNGQTTHRKKSKFLLSQTFKWKKIMFFVIPEMPSKTFVML